MKIINPATEEVIAEVAADTTESIQSKYESLTAGQKEWAKVPIKDRIGALAKFFEYLEAERDDLAATLTSEMGKPLNQAAGEVNGARHRINYFLENAEKWLAEEWIVQDDGMGEKIVFEPLGVIANISAWNYPYLVGVNVFVPALIAGNAVLYKPSEYSTLTGLKIAELLKKAGVPENVFAPVVGGAEAGESLLELPLDGYFFTGSYRTGRHIYQAVAPKMVPCQLELGGKDPMYVSADNTNIAGVAASGVEGAFYNAGQSCCAVERIYVHESIYDEYVDAFKVELEKMKVGDPTEEGVFIGPVARKPQLDFLAGQVQDAVNKGATLMAGGKAMDRPGYFFEPTFLANVTHDMAIMTEESFGPIIGIQKVKDDAEAVRLMQDTEYGLTAAVFSDNLSSAEPILEQIDSGTAYWNCCDRVSPNLPWSGRKHSGIGATLSYIGIRAFTKPKGYHLRGQYA